MTIRELEQRVWEQDKVRIAIRDRATARVGNYTYRNAAQGNWRITQFLTNRILPLVSDREVIVMDGKGNVPHGGTQLRTLRESYN